MRKYLLLLVLILISTTTVSAKPLPYKIESNSLIIDGRYYWDNGVPLSRSNAVQSHNLDDYNYSIINNIYKAYYSLNMSKDTAFLFEFDGTTVSFVPKSILAQNYDKTGTKAQNVQAVVNGNIITYPNMFGIGFDYRLIYSSDLVKEELILNTNPYPLALSNDTFILKSRFNYSNLIPYVNGIAWDKSSQSTSNEILFKNSNGEVYFEFVKPYAIDGLGNRIELSYDLSSPKTGGDANTLLIKLNVPMGWLKNATYPVTIDPSLELSGGSTTLHGTQVYDYVNLSNSAVLYVTAHNGTQDTGNLTLNLTYDLNVDSTSSINGASRGYRGGAGAAPYTKAGGTGGELAGAGGGSNGGSGDLSGGGAGGGGYANAGGNGGAGYGGGAGGGAGGIAVGTSTESDIRMGSGGGGGGSGDAGGSAGSGNPGGARLTINAKKINIRGTVNFNGGTGGNGGGAGYNYGGGGGGGASGGGIKLNATIVNISYATFTLNGGSGGAGGSGDYGSGSAGGAGSGGRIKIYYHAILNTSTSISAGTIFYSYTGNTVPTVPVLTAHADYHSSGSTTVSWTASTDADGDTITYDVRVGTSSGASNVLSQTGVSGTTSSSFTVTPTNTYYWSARAYDGYGYSNWATESSFTFTNSAPSTSQISFPSNNSRHYNNSINFTWNQSTDVDGDAVTYHWQIAQYSSFSSVEAQGNTSNLYSGSQTTYDMVTYYLRVRSNDSYEYSNWSNVIQFTENTAPSNPSILTPLNNSNHNNNSINFSWSQSTDSENDALTYHWQMSENSGFTLNLTQGNTSNLFSGLQNTSDGTTYYLRARAFDGYEYGSWSGVIQFYELALCSPSISGSLPLYQPLRAGTQHTFTVTSNCEVIFHWTNNNNAVSGSSNLTSSSYSASWSKGLNYLRVYGSNEGGVSQTIEWRIPILRTMASQPIATVNQSQYEDLRDATEALDFMPWLSATVAPYTVTLGNYFYLFLWLMVFSALWIRQGSITLPSVLGLVLGGSVIGMLPEEYRVYSIALIALGAIAVLYLIFTERR